MVRQLLKLTVCVCLGFFGAGLLSPEAQATLTVTAASKGSLGSSGPTYFYSLNTRLVDATTKKVDTSSGYGFVDAAETTAAGSIAFDVVTTREATVGKKMVLVALTAGQIILLRTSGALAFATTLPTSCNTSDCGKGAVLETNTSVRIFLTPKSVCDVSTLPGICNSGTREITVSNDSSVDLPLKFGIIEVDDPAADISSPVADAGIVESNSPTLRFSDTNLNYSACPSSVLPSLYFPGDSEIFVSSGLLTTNLRNNTTAVSTSSTPIDGIIMMANETGVGGAIPTASDYPSGTYSILQQKSMGGDQKFEGFQNSSKGGDQHVYQISFAVRDRSGLLGAFPAGCGLANVKTADIQGFLQKSKCFIATAAFRSMDAGPVVFLRQFRDEWLSSFKLGRQIIIFYYEHSERAAEWLIENPIFRYPVLKFLLPLQVFAWMLMHPILFFGILVGSVFSSGLLFWYLSRLTVYQMQNKNRGRIG